MFYQKEITLTPFKRGCHLITEKILAHLPVLPENGLLNLFLKHTSAAITLNENADPTVRYDFENGLSRLVPEKDHLYAHSLEGSDDMPAHLKSSLVGQSITIPVTSGQLNLGTWQGVYLCEFRNGSHSRQLVITLMGE